MPSQPPQGSSFRKPTDMKHFAPLQDIGSSRPRTTTSTKGSKGSPPCKGEKVRPATSDATPKNESFAHQEFNASSVASSYPRTLQPYGLAFSPEKSGLLEYEVHPAFRDHDKNVYPRTTDDRTESLVDHGPTFRDQQRLPMMQCTQQRAACLGTVATQAQYPDDSSPPPPQPPPPYSRVKRSHPFETVSPSPNSSPRKPRRRKVDDQQGAVDEQYRPTQGQESRERTPPPLPPRVPTTEASRPGSGRRNSDASTIFSDTGDTGGENAIATEDLDFAVILLQGKTFGHRETKFDWKPSQQAIATAKKCRNFLTSKSVQATVNAVSLLKIETINGDSDEVECAQQAWFLLSPEKRNLHVDVIIKDGFCCYFFHIYYTLRKERVAIPYQVPITVRTKIDPYYVDADFKFYMATRRSLQGNSKLASWIAILTGEKQGVSLIALLEIKMHSKDLLGSRRLLRSVSKSEREINTLRHGSTDQISNFFATFVREFSNSLGQTHADSLELSLNYFSDFWSYYAAEFGANNTDIRTLIFEATIGKLDNIDIPLCLWIFLTKAGTSLVGNMEDPAVGKMYLAMEAVLNVRMGSVTSRVDVIPIYMTVQFMVDAGIKNCLGFFNVMHGLMFAQGKVQDWERVWTDCQRQDLYTELVRSIV